LSASQFKTAFPRSSESFRLSITISPPVGVAFYADVPVGDYRIRQFQNTQHPALHGPASIHEGISIAANYILFHEENTKVNFVKLVDNPCGITTDESDR
jgi:hypothetical protein